jgi:hypothetical protein
MAFRCGSEGYEGIVRRPQTEEFLTFESRQSGSARLLNLVLEIVADMPMSKMVLHINNNVIYKYVHY